MQRTPIKSIKESNFLQGVLELSPLGAFLWDADGNCIYINKQLEALSGLSLEQSLGQGWINAVAKPDLPAVQDLLERMPTEKKPIADFVYRVDHPVRGLRWCRINACFVLDDDGVGQSYLGFVEDITEKTLYEHSLEEANEKLRRSEAELLKAKEELETTVSLLDATQEISRTGGWEYDVRSNTIFRTRQLQAMLFLTEGKAKLEDAASTYDEESELAIKTAIRATIEEQKSYDLLLRPRGTNKWFRSIGKPVVKDGKVEVIRGAVSDITEIKEAELELHEIKKRLERSNLLLDVSQELSGTAGWELNLQTGEVFWTRQAYLLHDVEEDFVLTFDNVLKFYQEEDREVMHRTAMEAVWEQKPYDLEVRITTAKNVRKWVRAIGVPVVENGEVVLVKGALMDITKIKEGEQALIQARNIAENSARAKSNFLSVMSHEIRTPLNGIIGIANLLKLNHTPDQKEYITNLIFCADHLLQLINDVLDLSKMESDRLELVYAPVDLFQLVTNIQNQFKSLAETKGIRLKSIIDDEIPGQLLADPIRLGQILNNLVSNAIKFTEQGEVTVLLRLAGLSGDRATIHFSIRDSGIGIAEHLHEAIFESFIQVQQSAYRKHSGTGLGLTITRKLIELYKSRIFIRSEPGAGTEFYFELELKLAKDRPLPVDPAAGQALSGYDKKLSGLRMLFVEDNPINVMVAMKQLEYFGIVPDCVLSGKEALVLLENNDYHVALLDLHMPEIDGYALAEIIRTQYPGIHIIIFTADIMTEVKVKLAKLNIYDILNKPFAPEKMYEILSTVARAKAVLKD